MPTEPDPALDFGVFDHLDQGGRQPSDFFEQRLRLLEKYDHAGFYAFHPAEHHGTPLSLSPLPNVFLAAAAARTTRIRLAPLVYVLPLYRPLRLIEEICTLDQLSRGRLEIGVGRGIAPFELVINGINPLDPGTSLRKPWRCSNAGSPGRPSPTMALSQLQQCASRARALSETSPAVLVRRFQGSGIGGDAGAQGLEHLRHYIEREHQRECRAFPGDMARDPG